METIGVMKVSRNYQVTIPFNIRQKFPVREGDLVRVVYDDDEKVVKLYLVRNESG
ncbi:MULTISPECIES: AbrB/MazE/SpoVT family DNA-binding domain-containing protein [Acidianus]|uniref:AbrB family transcriptional regulator n=1 Tax=Candidatus Acidianus copahuensis TaxID=1160895 RepID=A0A031LX39_9CREN|nr:MULTISPECIES: AbrB/MazE/SpoVT family DNA-binding domain-containing protein [Acidianus]EZQ12044.1 AbrB family transcriptional regulator [Candidatus Acidianus copahuensis]NON63057.1 AbrB/MazE/SpoVT family DNA-binding domain-containing protein [Acidianus sp. RZ1]